MILLLFFICKTEIQQHGLSTLISSSQTDTTLEWKTPPYFNFFLVWMDLNKLCLKIHFILKCVYLSVCVCVHVHIYMQMCVQVSQSTEDGFSSLELELKVVVNYWMWVMISELRTSARARHSFNHRTKSPAPMVLGNICVNGYIFK